MNPIPAQIDEGEVWPMTLLTRAEYDKLYALAYRAGIQQALREFDEFACWEPDCKQCRSLNLARKVIRQALLDEPQPPKTGD